MSVPSATATSPVGPSDGSVGDSALVSSARQGNGPQLSISSYLASFGWALHRSPPIPWPADVFAVANLVLDHTEAYRYAVSPPPGRRWPPESRWSAVVTAAARDWRRSLSSQGAGVLPAEVQRCWDVVLRNARLSLAGLRHHAEPELCEALLTLHAVADEVHRVLAVPVADEDSSFITRARRMLAECGTFSHLPASRIRVLPKTQLTTHGLTIRSFSRYLALSYEAIEIEWTTVTIGEGSWVEGRDFYTLLLPWPLVVDASAFRPVAGPLGMDPEAFGFFAYQPTRALAPSFLSNLIDAALDDAPRVDTVVLPESAIDRDEIGPIEDLLAERGVPSLVAGTRQPPEGGRMARNYLHFGLLTDEGWVHFEQDKHHRWCLDPAQIRQYHLTRALAPTRQWWEAIELPTRSVRIIDLGGGATTAAMICEDLARLDEVAAVLRRIGPNFVMALLLDGPQLAQRWACRYASVLADDPGCAVLTLTSLGMVRRSRPPGLPPSRTVAMWTDPTSGSTHLELERGASAMLTRSTIGSTTAWTADGRRHPASMPSSVLTGVRQLRSALPPRDRP
jgi:hypothetical protein